MGGVIPCDDQNACSFSAYSLGEGQFLHTTEYVVLSSADYSSSSRPVALHDA